MKPSDYAHLPIDDLTSLIIHEMYQTYNMYGPGLFESVYEATLEGRLVQRGLFVERQKTIYLNNDYVSNEQAFRADLIVENRVVIEIKSVEKIPAVSYMQLRTYLNLLEIDAGLLVNFNCSYLKNNIRRIGRERTTKIAV
ncbi:GxxExxY protein [Lewinella sp. 4G2]|uniref:GxxExxY protein n=1 Tax=Lewinella sp. 4G2 TaxID=1803372 RepID=UPI0007B4D6AF|nr:GxxExxY protein [Lewinella sp. 4G2]OAV42725.1 hypothetical protein A3850_015915 [Lewinella sp. 4G2]